MKKKIIITKIVRKKHQKRDAKNMKKQKCERCSLEMDKVKLTEKQIEQKFNELIEQGNTIGGLAPHNDKFKNFKLATFLLEYGYTYFECPKCGWFKFKKELN